MPKRLAALFPGLVVILALASPASAGWSGLPACGGGTTQNCVIAVERNGIPLGAADPAYEFSSLMWSDPDGTDHFNFSVSAGTSALTTTETWAVVLNTGSVVPEETFARGRNVTIARGDDGSGNHTVRFTMDPVRMADGGCNSSGTCIPVAPNLRAAYIDGWIDDLAYVTDAVDRAAMRGFDLASNTDWVSSPLQLDFATNAIVLDVANSHFEPDGTTVFKGAAEFRIPNAMLRRLYNVDDPATLTASAFRVTTGSGPATTVVDVNPGSVRVAISGLTFSKRRLRIRGDMRPLRPRELRAVRSTPTRALLRFNSSRRRGSKVRGYTASCRSGAHRVSGQRRRPPIRVRGLIPGRSYHCRVRAKSRAGLGRVARTAIPAVS